MCVIYVQVTLCSNTVKRYRLALVVDVEGVGEEIMTLPINARSNTSTNVNVNTLSNTYQSGLVLWCLPSFSKILILRP